MAKKILVILGHPSNDSLNKTLADSYVKGAKNADFKIKKIYLSEIKFDPILHEGYKKIQKLEPDLLKAQEYIKWAEHIVFFYPIWWGFMPAIMKGFIDRIFLPGFAFKYHEGGKHSKYLEGKTASLIITTGGPKWIYFFAGKIINLPMTIAILRFCGVKPKKQIFFSGLRKDSSEEKIKKIMEKVKIFGEKGI